MFRKIRIFGLLVMALPLSAAHQESAQKEMKVASTKNTINIEILNDTGVEIECPFYVVPVGEDYAKGIRRFEDRLFIPQGKSKKMVLHHNGEGIKAFYLKVTPKTGKTWGTGPGVTYDAVAKGENNEDLVQALKTGKFHIKVRYIPSKGAVLDKEFGKTPEKVSGTIYKPVQLK